MADETVISSLKKAFEDTFGAPAELVCFAPGRVNLIGEHIDYNGGHVFPCALTLGTYGAARRRADRNVRMASANFPEAGVTTVSLDDLAYKKEDGWTNYVKGVIWAFAKNGYNCESGFDFMVSGTIPNKSGLSSSASLEVLTGETMMEMFSFDNDQIHNALFGQQAENQFVGMNCGIMDQFASAMGKKDKAIFLNTATLDYSYAPVVLKDAELIIVNTNKPHELTDSAYNERRSQCEEALAILQKAKPIKALCDLTPDEFDEVKGLLTNDVLLRRARHAVTEDARTVAAVKALDAGNLGEFGKLMNASHVSLRDDFEVSCRELDILAEEAWKIPGTIGARMTGGGFGGCTVNIVRSDAVPEFIERVGNAYKEKVGYEASFYRAAIGDGPHRVDG
ncbi:MAG: galactokinase [Chordicoccus sp.]